MKAAKFDRLGVFSYSDEDTSASFHLDGKVDARTIYNRKRQLMAMQRKISRDAQPRSDRPRGSGAGGRAVRRFGAGVASAPVDASAGDRRRLLHFRSRRAAAEARARSGACASPRRTITI